MNSASSGKDLECSLGQRWVWPHPEPTPSRPQGEAFTPVLRSRASAASCVSVDTRTPASPVARLVKNPSAKAGDSRDAGWIPGSGRSAGEGNDNLLQYPCLENPVDRGPGGLQSEYTHTHKCMCSYCSVLTQSKDEISIVNMYVTEP